MDFLERKPLPVECEICNDPECDSCTIGLERWYIPHDLDLRIQRRGLLRALERERGRSHPIDWIEDRIQEIEMQLLPFTEDQINAIEHRAEMTKQIFDDCIAVCIRAQDPEMQDALRQYFPDFEA